MSGTTNTCPVCTAEQPDGLCCHACTTILERELGDVPSIVADLDVTISKQAKIGQGTKGGLASERTPINIGASAVADDLTNTLTTWARDVWPRWRNDYIEPRPAVVAVQALLCNIDSIRRHPAVNELFDEITDAIKQARRVVDRPADRIYLGQCLVETPDEDGRAVTCLEEIYARPGAHEVRCKVCGITHEVADRREEMLTRAQDMLFTVREASQMMGAVGHIVVTEDRIRGYLRRGRIGYRAGNTIRLGDLLAVVLDEGERRAG